jgi:hypothetical protein
MLPRAAKARQAEPRINADPVSNSRSSGATTHPARELLRASWWLVSGRDPSRHPGSSPWISQYPGRSLGPHPKPTIHSLSCAVLDDGIIRVLIPMASRCLLVFSTCSCFPTCFPTVFFYFLPTREALLSKTTTSSESQDESRRGARLHRLCRREARSHLPRRITTRGDCP